MEIKPLSIEHLELVSAAAKNWAKESLDKNADPMALEMLSWSAPWRVESLTHYLNVGWSLGAFKENKLIGFILCQPLLYFTSLTQSLWIEDVDGETTQVAEELMEVAYKWARTKHLQRVYFNENISTKNLSFKTNNMTLSYNNSTKMS